MRFRERNYDIYRLPLTLDSPRSRQPQEPLRLEGDIPNSMLQSIFAEARARDGSAIGGQRCETNAHARFRLRGPSYIRCKNYIWSICIYMYTQKYTHTHAHGQTGTRIHATHVHDTRATRVRVARAPRAQTYAYVCTIIVSRR